MAEAFLRAAMREVGIDISSARTKKGDPYLHERFHYFITLCDRRTERSYPVFPDAIWRHTWEPESPAALETDGMSHAMAVPYTRDKIRQHVTEFVEKHHRPRSERGQSAWK
jgi:protein-tyrosine-phosphatase